MDDKNFEHLVKEIPNNFLTRYLVKKVNQKMRKSESRYRLVMRYRKPKKGFKYAYGGRLEPTTRPMFPLIDTPEGQRKNKETQAQMAHSFSIYLRLTESAKKADRKNQENIWRMNKLSIERGIKRGLEEANAS